MQLSGSPLDNKHLSLFCWEIKKGEGVLVLIYFRPALTRVGRVHFLCSSKENGRKERTPLGLSADPDTLGAWGERGST